MKAGSFITVIVLAALMTLGTLGEVSQSGPWFLHWLDVRWWWHWIAVVYSWGSSIVNIDVDFHSPEGRIGE